MCDSYVFLSGIGRVLRDNSLMLSGRGIIMGDEFGRHICSDSFISTMNRIVSVTGRRMGAENGKEIGNGGLVSSRDVQVSGRGGARDSRVGNGSASCMFMCGRGNEGSSGRVMAARNQKMSGIGRVSGGVVVMLTDRCRISLGRDGSLKSCGKEPR